MYPLVVYLNFTRPPMPPDRLYVLCLRGGYWTVGRGAKEAIPCAHGQPCEPENHVCVSIIWNTFLSSQRAILCTQNALWSSQFFNFVCLERTCVCPEGSCVRLGNKCVRQRGPFAFLEIKSLCPKWNVIWALRGVRCAWDMILCDLDTH